jgi:hypothetical protein
MKQIMYIVVTIRKATISRYIFHKGEEKAAMSKFHSKGNHGDGICVLWAESIFDFFPYSEEVKGPTSESLAAVGDHIENLMKKEGK